MSIVLKNRCPILVDPITNKKLKFYGRWGPQNFIDDRLSYLMQSDEQRKFNALFGMGKVYPVQNSFEQQKKDDNLYIQRYDHTTFHNDSYIQTFIERMTHLHINQNQNRHLILPVSRLGHSPYALFPVDIYDTGDSGVYIQSETRRSLYLDWS